MHLFRRLVKPSPQAIEAVGLVILIGVVAGTCAAICQLPSAESTRQEIMRILEVGFGALGAAALLFLWAQLRHAAMLNKLLAYHEYFHDLPATEKASTLYSMLSRLGIEVPLWQAPLSEAAKEQILKDGVPECTGSDIVVRDYLNDFEAFAAAVNSGLVDEHYAYHLEGARTLNAYFGFREMIDHWLAEDRKKASRLRESGITPSDYYGELKKLAERWKQRKLREATRLSRIRNGIESVI